MGIAREDGTIEESEQIIDPTLTLLVEGESPVTISPTNISTPEENPGMRISSRVKFQTKP